ncbi:hypothetical protein RCL1_003408 [Eukaryota sp. TZLM3-RCL]
MMKLLFVLAIVAALAVASDQNNIKCSSCEFYVGYFYSQISADASKEEITAYMKTACDRIPRSLQGPCKNFVDKYTAEMIDLLVAQYSPLVICQKLGLCEANFVEEVVSEVEFPWRGIACDSCQWVIQQFESYITTETSEKTVVAFLSKVCQYAPQSIKQSCNELISNYYPQLLELLVAKFPPKYVCELLTLCEKPTNSANDIMCPVCTFVIGWIESKVSEETTRQEIIGFVEQVCNFVPASLNPTCKLLVEQYGNLIIDLMVERFSAPVVCQMIGMCPQANDNDILCPVCTFVIGWIESKVSEETTRQEIIGFVEQVCNFVPASLNPTCKLLVEQYGNLIIDLMVERFSAPVVCQMIGMCPQANDNDILCPVCTFVIGWIESKVSEETTRQEIIGFVEQVCNFVPASLNPTCKLLVEQYGNLIIDLMVERFSAATICQKIGMCPQPATENGFAKCKVCTYIVGKIEMVLTDESTIGEIVHFMETVCDHAPAFLVNDCKAFVGEFGGKFIHWIVDRVSPQRFCSMIRVCETEAPVLIPSPVLDFTCDACKTAVAAGFKYLDNVDPKAVSKYCEMVEDKFQQILCKGFVEGYLPIIIKNFEEAYAPEKTCALIKLCPAA